MKYKHTTLLAAIVLMGLTIFASCKKDNETTAPEANNIQCASITHPEQIDDMNAYLEQFKQQLMGDSKGDEMMTIEDANWFLTNLSNYDFGNVVEQFDDIMFDDIYTDVNISNGMVSLADLNDAYKQIFNEIRNYYHSHDLQEKNLRIIICTINPDGTVETHITLSYGNGAKAFGGFYFNSGIDCNQYLDSTIVYHGNTTAVSELNRILNLQVFHSVDYSTGRLYYTLHTTRKWMPMDLFDYVTPSPSDMYSRLYYQNGGYDNDAIPLCNMRYYLDSYAGIVEDYWPMGCCLASIEVEWNYGQANKDQAPHWHSMTVRYGVLQGSTSEPSVD